MERLFELTRFFEYENRSPFSIEPERRLDLLFDQISRALKTYNPSVVIKAGIGNPALLSRVEPVMEGRFIVIDPSVQSIKNYRSDNPDTKIDFICGEFNLLPVDYYAADLLINTDNLNYLESGRAVDEFRRCLQFEGHLFISVPVVAGDDFDGVFDELYRAASSLHNDFYMTVDLKTFLDLNEFKFVSGDEYDFRFSLGEMKKHFGDFDPSSPGAVSEYIDENGMPLKTHYGYDSMALTEKWFTGIFMRKKPEKEQPPGKTE